MSRSAAWPALPLDAWKDTFDTLRLWTQIVGKIRLALAPHINHYWQATLYVTARGLTTSPIPHRGGTFQIDFDFLDQRLRIDTSAGTTRALALRSRSVADFYEEFMATLRGLEIEVRIWTMPQEVAEPIRFERDTLHATYDPEYATRHWRVLVQAERLLTSFRSDFIGKCSPVHFFWGGFDLAVTRFSGRTAPRHPGGNPYLADRIQQESYSHEVSSCGFWPGGGPVLEAAFYSYAYPEPAGFPDYDVAVSGAFFYPEMRLYLLPYEAVRAADDPDELVLAFCQRTYEAAADLGHWDRAALERTPQRELTAS